MRIMEAGKYTKNHKIVQKFETDFTLIEEYWRCGHHGQYSVQSIVGSNLEIVNFIVK